MRKASRESSGYVLGARICATKREAVVVAIAERARQRIPGGVLLANVHMLIEKRRDHQLAKAMAAAPVVVADGTPVAWWLRLKGCRSAERLAGIDLLYWLCAGAAEDGLRVLIYGGQTKKECALVRQRLLDRVPRLKLRVEPAPWIQEPMQVDTVFQELVEQYSPNLVFTCLGCPKQEIWIHYNADIVQGPVLGVGAAFGFLAGHKERAPCWMQCVGMEWIHRLAQEPGRLMARYLKTNLMFIVLGIVDLSVYWWRRAVR